MCLAVTDPGATRHRPRAGLEARDSARSIVQGDGQHLPVAYPPAMDASLAALFFVFATLGTLFLVIYWAVRLAIRHERTPGEPRE